MGGNVDKIIKKQIFNKDEAIKYMELQIKQIQDFIDSGKKSVSSIDELKARQEKFKEIIELLKCVL